VAHAIDEGAIIKTKDDLHARGREINIFSY
jgi:hypothetical protein